MESNDSPEIPDRGETSDIPGLLNHIRTEGDFHKRYIVEKTTLAEIRPEEQSEKAESFRENLRNETQLKGSVLDTTNQACPLLCVLFLCLFLSSWPFQLYFIAYFLPTILYLLTLFYPSYLLPSA